MPGRKKPLIKGFYYHVLNRGISDIQVFSSAWNYKRFIDYLIYYQNINTPGRYSYFLNLPKAERIKIMAELRKKKDFYVDIVSFCLMPTHFHLLLRQNTDSGISEYLSKISNAYTRYFNSATERKGPLFQGTFKSIKINTEQQLLHVSRYIHLNPYSGGLVKNYDDLIDYQYSSLPEYLNDDNGYCQNEVVLSKFKTKRSYRDFILNHADFQRELQFIKHLTLE